STWVFLTTVLIIGETQSALSALAIFGFGLLPMKLIGPPSRAINALYIALVVPSIVLLVHIVLANYILTIISVLMIPIPAAYKQYWDAVSALGAATLIAMRVILAYIAIYLVASVALFAFIFAALLVYYFMPLFSFHIIPLAPIVLTFILISMAIWLPALHLRRSENMRAHTIVLIVLCAAISLDLVILLQITDPILNLLGVTTIFSILFTISMPVMLFIERRARSAAIAFSAALLLGLYLTPVDLISKLLLAAFGIALIAVPVLSEDNRVMLAYPAVTGALFSFLFWHLYLFTFDASLVVSGFIAVESLLLSIPEQLRTKLAWIAFASSTGVTVAIMLSPFMNINLVLAALVAIEILRFTPGVAIGEKTGLFLGVARAGLVGASAYLLIVSWVPVSSPIRDPLMVIGLSGLAATIVLAVSMSRFVSSESLVALQSIAVVNVCFVIFPYLWVILGFDILYSLYLAGIPLLAFTGIRAMRDTFKRGSWMLSCLLSTAMISFGWYAFYRSLESFWLCLPTAFFLLSSLRLTDPKGLEDKAGATNLEIGTSILLLEVVWIWHSLLVFFLNLDVIIAGIGLLLAPVILLPLRGAVSWDVFRTIWGVVGAIIAISMGFLLTGWDLYSLTQPTEPYLAAGVILSSFSLLTTPVYLWFEGRLNINEDHLTARFSWSPSLLGWAAVGVEIGVVLLNEMRLMLAAGGLGFALAVLILYMITPDRPRALFVADIVILASAVAGVVWIWAEPVLGPTQLIAVFLFVWYLLSLPLTIAATITFLGWLSSKVHQLAAAFSRFLSWAIAGLTSAIRRVGEVLRRNKAKFAAFLPVLLGSLVILWIYNPLDTSTLLGLPIRSLGFAVTLGVLVTGLFYWFEAIALESEIGDSFQILSMITFGTGVNSIILLMSLTATEYNPLELAFSLCLAASLAIIAILAQAGSFGMKVWMRRITGVLGVGLFGATYTGLTSLAEIVPYQAIVYAAVLLVVVEIPVFWTQVKAFIGLLSRFGAVILAALKNLGSILLNIFRKFGYYMWAFFAVLFVAIIGVLSRPLFSELLNMPPSGVFYEVPGFSMPAAILGLLMLFFAIVRGQVRTRFGLFSGLFAAFGGGITAFVVLFDYGYQILSLYSGIIAICGTGLILKGELQLKPKQITILWIPIPVSLSASLFYYLLQTAGSLDSILLALLLSLTPTFMLYLLSTTADWIPKNQRELLWSILAVMTGVIAYLGSYLLMIPPFDQVAGIYLGVFVASLIMYPVTARSARQLFLSPLFFALTGFAYTFVLGPVYQSLLLASAAFLLFVSRYIKEKEAVNPRLVYLRLIVLLALVASIAAFSITTGLEILTVG
ncbi:MAG: hypothetical protein ACXADC_16915, partial [Candidatus Thorarchaeota archaeon]